MKRALRMILLLSLGGLAFSSYLTYRELFVAAPVAACAPLGEPGTIAGYPACVYGMFMFAGIAAIASAGLWRASAAYRAPSSPLPT